MTAVRRTASSSRMKSWNHGEWAVQASTILENFSTGSGVKGTA